MHICRPILKTLGEQVEQFNASRRPRIISEWFSIENKRSLYTTSSYDEVSGDELTCSVSILPQVDQIPNMFTYVPLQKNILAMTKLADLLLDEEDEDIKKLLNSVQSDTLVEEETLRSGSITRRSRRSTKTPTTRDKNNEYIFDDEHLMELLKRLKQQPGHASTPMGADDESNLFDTLI
ncbi:unnamed protein product, partial [Rotaria socialis]